MQVTIKSVTFSSAVMLDVILSESIARYAGIYHGVFDGLIGLPKYHITLLSIKTLKNLSANEIVDIKCRVFTTPYPTIVNCSGFYRTKRFKDNTLIKESVFTEVIEQDILREYLNKIAPGLECDRYFHISVANLTGNGIDSIGDISINDKL